VPEVGDRELPAWPFVAGQGNLSIENAGRAVFPGDGFEFNAPPGREGFFSDPFEEFLGAAPQRDEGDPPFG
jgi:hypothetical protein